MQDYAPRPSHLKWLLGSDPAIRWHPKRGRNSNDEGLTDVELTKAEEAVAATKAQGKAPVPAPAEPVANRNKPLEA